MAEEVDDKSFRSGNAAASLKQGVVDSVEADLGVSAAATLRPH